MRNFPNRLFEQPLSAAGLHCSPDDPPAGAAADRTPTRAEIDKKYRWNVEALYPDFSSWEKDFEKIDALTEPLEKLKGKLTSAQAVAEMYVLDVNLSRLLDKLYTYAHLRADEDTGHSENQGYQARIRAKWSEIGGRLAWISPEILSRDEAVLKEWAKADVLKDHRYSMIQLIRQKPHTLSDKEETLLSRAGEVFSAPQQAFTYLTNADMRFPSVDDGKGNEKEMTQGRYLTFLLDRDREVRRSAFESMYDTYGSYENTLASTLTSNVKLHNYMAKTRNHPSALEASLFGDNIPVSVYNSLIDATHAAFPHFYRYMGLRAKRLGREKVDMYDVYVPIVPSFDIKVDYEEGVEWIIEACKPLGDAYVKVLKTAFTNGWVDVLENKGKRSGAYSSGCYDSMPYILMNYHGNLDDVFTLAHELGHSMHSWLAKDTQPPQYADYSLFVAEIASTMNEALLLDYLLDKTDDPRFEAYLLNHLCDSFKGTVYRQVMFAEFEKQIHELDAARQPLTADTLKKAYYTMNAEYYGDHVAPDQRIEMEWARIPHFYYNFYVYKYATSFCASQIFAQRIHESPSAVESYLNLLRAGGSADPLELVQRAGVDLSDRKAVEQAFERFGQTVDQLDGLLDRLDQSPA